MSPTLDFDDVAPNSPRITDYKKEGIISMVKARGGWLTVFFVGLVLAAVVVERFEDLLTSEVELSYFVPLLIGHGGNTGSQSVATVIRAVALKQISPRDMLSVLFKEAVAGVLMGAFLGFLARANLFRDTVRPFFYLFFFAESGPPLPPPPLSSGLSWPARHRPRRLHASTDPRHDDLCPPLLVCSLKTRGAPPATCT